MKMFENRHHLWHMPILTNEIGYISYLISKLAFYIFIFKFCLFYIVYLGNSLALLTETEPNFIVEMSSGKNIALLGGGPSSIPALVYLLETKENAKFYGDVVSSLLLSGRDPQKTYRALLMIAEKFKTFSNLKEQTKDYYSYLSTSSKHFGLSLSDTIDIVNSGKYQIFNNKCLFKSNLNQNKFYEVEIKEREYFINSSKLTKEIQNFGLYSFTENEITNKLINFGDFQKFLHYLPVFFRNWEKPTSNIDENIKIIDRAGFEYPSNTASELLGSLNFDLAELYYNLLKATSTDSNELEEILKNVFKSYIETHSKEVLNKENTFIIIGGGRAAGEVARRVYNDLDWTRRTQHLQENFKEKVDKTTLNDLIKTFQTKMKERRRNVIVIDHKKLTQTDLIEESERFKKVVNCDSYSDFLFEICKHGVCPELNEEQTKYYKNFLEKVASYEGEKASSLERRLQNLLQGQEGLVTSVDDKQVSYRVEITDTRDENDLINLQILPKESNFFSIGGAKHNTSWRRKVDVKVNSDNSYELKRIMRSHYRSENLHFIEEIAKLNKEPARVIRKITDSL